VTTLRGAVLVYDERQVNTRARICSRAPWPSCPRGRRAQAGRGRRDRRRRRRGTRRTHPARRRTRARCRVGPRTPGSGSDRFPGSSDGFRQSGLGAQGANRGRGVMTSRTSRSWNSTARPRSPPSRCPAAGLFRDRLKSSREWNGTGSAPRWPRSLRSARADAVSAETAGRARRPITRRPGDPQSDRLACRTAKDLGRARPRRERDRRSRRRRSRPRRARRGPAAMARKSRERRLQLLDGGDPPTRGQSAHQRDPICTVARKRSGSSLRRRAAAPAGFPPREPAQRAGGR